MLTVQPPVEMSATKNAAQSILVDKGGILVARVEPLCNLTDIVRQERERRTEELWWRLWLNLTQNKHSLYLGCNKWY